MIGSLVGLGVSAGLAGVQYAMNRRNAKKDEKNRPEYQIPSEIQANMTQAEQMAMQGLPEEQKQQYINNLQRSQAFSMNQASSRKAGLAGLAAVNQQGIDAYGDLMSKDAQARQQNQKLAMEQRGVMADYKDQAFQLNKLNPYYEKIASREAANGALMQNLGNSLPGLAGGAVDLLTGKAPDKAPAQQPFATPQTNASNYKQRSGLNNQSTPEGFNNYGNDQWGGLNQ
jgi:hypothetical protein